jgi:hypothetical protein
MKTILKFLIFTASIFFLGSCQDVVQVKLDEGSKLYVIDAFINNTRNQQSVRVVTNDNYFSASEPPPVTNAKVVLRDLNSNKDYIFNYSTNGYYVYDMLPGDTIGVVSHQYQLLVTIDGLAYSAITTQKRAAVMDTITAEALTGGGGFGGPPTTDTTYFCTLSAGDLVDANTDYYWIKTYRNDTLFNDPGDLNLCIDGTGGAITSAATDTIDFSEPAILLGFKRYHKNATCKVEIHSIARDTYFFLLQAAQQINNGGLFATTPENVKTNIVTPSDAKTKAVGWFSMATVVSEKITVK